MTEFLRGVLLKCAKELLSFDGEMPNTYP